MHSNAFQSLSGRSIVLIGPIAPPQWGPAVRNRIMLDTFQRWGMNAVPVNTLAWRNRPFAFFWSLSKACCRQHHVFLSVSRHGCFVLIPLLWFLRPFCRLRLAFMPAGGGFADDLNRLPTPIRAGLTGMLRNFDLLCVQTSFLQSQLKTMGLSALEVVPNFKNAPDSQGSQQKEHAVPRILFLSRIRPLKGLETMFAALDQLHDQGYRFTLDLYGIISVEYMPEFDLLIRQRHYAAYKGVLPYDQVISAITDYDFMIFPSLSVTEGFPGVLTDAALAGLPVIASDLPSTREIIRDGYNGLLFEPGNPAQLAVCVKKLLNDSTLRRSMAAANKAEGARYTTEVVLGNLLRRLESLGWWSNNNNNNR